MLQSDGHITPEMLDAFILGTIPPEDTRQISFHLGSCPTCRLAFIERMKTVELPDEASQINSADPPIDASELKPPAIPGFHSVERLAQGGMGTVYLATRNHTDQEFAIKCVSLPRDSVDSDRKERLVREAHALTKLDHPNIVRAIEVVLVQDVPALVMEYVPGKSLHRWRKHQNPDDQTIVNLMLQLTSAIEHAHQHGVIHCDLKPQNVLVTNAQSPITLKLIDFGLAKFADESWSITHSGDILGSPAYMAPERLTGNAICANPSVDIYGLGAILYELLSGQPPYQSDSVSDLMTKIGRLTPKSLRHSRPDLPMPLENICMKCLEKRPKDRYKSAEALRNDLQEFLNGRPVSAKPPRFGRKLARLVSLRVVLTTAIGTAILFAIAFGLALRQTSRSKDQLQSLLQSSETRVDQAQAAVIEELRASLEETTELLFGSQPTKEDAETKTLDRIAQRWERIGQSMGNTIEGQQVKAEALQRLGSIHAILGDPLLADQKLRQSLALLEILKKDSPKSSQILRLVAEANSELGKTLFDTGSARESEKAFLEAIENGSQALKIDPSDQTAALLLAKVQRDFGVALDRFGKLSEASRQFDDASSTLDILLKGAVVNRDPLIALAWSIRNAKGMLLRKLGDPNGALRLLEDVPETFKEWSDREPEDPIVWRLTIVQRFTRGLCQMDLGRFELAQGSIQDCMRLQKRLIALQPRRPDHRKNYGVFLGQLGLVSLRLNHPDQAIEHLIESVRVNSEITSENPDQKDYIHEKCKSLSNLVAILNSVNRLDEAISYGVELLQLESKLCRESPDQPEYAYLLGVASNLIAFSHTKLGRYQEAKAMLALSEATYMELTQKYPKVSMYYANKIKTGISIAEVANLEQDWNAAIDTSTRVIQEVLNHSSGPPIEQSIFITKAYLAQALAYKALGQYSSSRICADFGRSTMEPWKDHDAASRGLYLQCSELIDKEHRP